MTKSKFLQGIRGAAAIAVVYTHCNNILAPINNSFHHIGEQAVLCFYTLSAFLLTWRLLCDWHKLCLFCRENKVDGKDRFFYKFIEICKYALRRFFRIYPAYFVCVCAIALVPFLQ